MTKYGTLYEATRDLSVREIATKIRAAYKAMPELRGFSISVRTRRVTHAQAIDVEVTGVPKGFTVLDLAAEESEFRTPRTPASVALLAKMQAVHDAYNYNGSDPMSDYCHVRYYGDVSWAGDLLRQERRTWYTAQVVARHTAERAQETQAVREARCTVRLNPRACADYVASEPNLIEQ